MAYLGRQPIIGNYQVLDAITATTTDTYALTKNSVAVFPQTPANCIVSLNGVIQAPFDSYTISGSDIVFASALTGSDSIDFITVLGDVLNVGTVSDSTITTAKIADANVTSAKMFSGFANGITMAQMWRINASTSATSTPADLTANWEIADTSPTGTLGTGLTESSGIFSFPSTGYYWIGCTGGFRNNNGTRNASIQLKATINNSSYTAVAIGECHNSDFGGANNTSMSAFTQYMFDITDTANQKFKLSVAADTTQTVDGSTTSQYTGFQIIRLGDT